MSAPFEGLAGLDRLIHEPARLSITTTLEACDWADFLFLQRITGLSKGNLSSHLAKLERAGIVEIHKSFDEKIPHTGIRLTPAGRTAVTAYWKRLDGLRKAARAWKPATRQGGSARRVRPGLPPRPAP